VLVEFSELLPANALVLDAGCGAGAPVTRRLAQRHRVVGIDFSVSQLRLASGLVPPARLSCQDMTRMALSPGVFDGICSFYAIIHIPRDRHARLLADMHRLLRVGGLALLCLGAEDLEAEYDSYLGTPMFWSHFDSATYLAMLRAIGFHVMSSQIIPDPIATSGGHLFVLARKDGPATTR
jgi:SAM-dependent methyltransferase